MNNVKTIVSIPAWAEAYNEGRGSSNQVADAPEAYAKVPLVFRAARIRANALRKLPVHFRRIGAEEDSESPFEIDFGDLVWRTEMALCFRGGATWLRNVKQLPALGVEVSQGLAWLNPFTVNLEYKEGIGRTYYQQIGAARYPKQGVWTDDDVVFIREFSFADDVGWGIAPADVALGSAQLSFYLRRVASVFFETGAMPPTLVQIAGLSPNPEDLNNKRVSEFFRRVMTGVGKFARILATGNDVKMTTTQSPLKDMVIPELSMQSRKEVALAFEVPVTLLDDDANYATAKEHKRGFYDETIIPRSDQLAEEFNRQWLNPLGYEIVFTPEEMDLYQEDESARAVSLGSLVSAINTDPATARFAMGVLGYDLSAEQQAELDAMIADKETKRVEAAEQFRERMNSALPNDSAPTARPARDEQVIGSIGGKAFVVAPDFAKWERKALKAMGNGKPAAVPFNSDEIPASLGAAIGGALEVANDPADVKAIFSDAAAWRGYPGMAGTETATSNATGDDMQQIVINIPQREVKASLLEESGMSLQAAIEAFANALRAQPAPVVNVDVAAPVIPPFPEIPPANATVSPAPAPVVNVNLPKPIGERTKFVKDKAGNITGSQKEIIYEE